MLVTKSLLCCIASCIVTPKKQLCATSKMTAYNKIKTHFFAKMFFRQGSDGKWRSQESGIEVPPNSPLCKHEWQNSTRFHPVPAIAIVGPHKKTFHVECVKCGFEKQTCIRLPMQNQIKECEHDWQENHELGPLYSAQICSKCFETQCVKVELKNCTVEK